LPFSQEYTTGPYPVSPEAADLAGLFHFRLASPKETEQPRPRLAMDFESCHNLREVASLFRIVARLTETVGTQHCASDGRFQSSPLCLISRYILILSPCIARTSKWLISFRFFEKPNSYVSPAYKMPRSYHSSLKLSVG
jgi:hypothetical protein